jgi:hypothetical protein
VETALSFLRKEANMESKLFDSYGWFIGTLPEDCVSDCSAAGDVFAAAEYWRKEIDFQVPRELAARYLEAFGAWDDLDTVEDETLARRVLWIACGDMKEQGEWLGLIH